MPDEGSCPSMLVRLASVARVEHQTTPKKSRKAKGLSVEGKARPRRAIPFCGDLFPAFESYPNAWNLLPSFAVDTGKREVFVFKFEKVRLVSKGVHCE